MRRLVADIVASVQAEVPAFADLDPDDVRRIAAGDLRRGEAAMTGHQLPSKEALEAIAAVTARLARAGVPLDAINRARGIAARRVFETWRESGGDEPSSQVETLHWMWNWTQAVAARIASAYREVELEVEGRDEDKQAWYLRGLLDGTLSLVEAQSRAPAYGLLPGRRYIPLRARSSDDVDARQLQRAIEAGGRAVGDGAGALVAVVEGDVWGLVSRPPALPAGHGVVGLGPAAELSGVPDAFKLAERALETAMALGRRGVVDIDDLSLRPIVLSEDHLGDRLVRRYLDPLRELGEFGVALERTVRQYLECGMRIDESARALIVHPNTLRHRLDRFQQVTGADLRRTEDLVEVWWALERRRVTG